jgi:LCP family protein required for cell wall assembly
MDPQNKHLRHIKISVLATLITFLVVVTGFAFLSKKNNENLQLKNNQISNLIDEVGALNETSDQIIKNSDIRDKKIKGIYTQLENLDKHFSASLDAKDQSLEEMKNSFQGAKDELNSILQNKEAVIASLAQKNKQLKDELDIPDFSSNITDVLIIGQNSGLTDAMLIASINPDTKKISIFSVPRDLYHKGRKINELYNLYGLDKLKEALYQVTGVQIDYYVMFDFNSFIAVIDKLQGIDINVEKDIIDAQYPGPNFSYTKVSFKKGDQQMDGQTALKYVRSRKSTTDFDRSLRQQQVVMSIKQKLLALNVLTDINTVTDIYGAIKDHIKSDLGMFEAMALYENAHDYSVNSGNVISNKNFLYTTKSKTGQYILMPVNGSYSEIKKYVADLIKG